MMIATNYPEMDQAFRQLKKLIARANQSRQQDPQVGQWKSEWDRSSKKVITNHIDAFLQHVQESSGQASPFDKGDEVGVKLSEFDGVSVASGLELVFSFSPGNGSVAATVRDPEIKSNHLAPVTAVSDALGNAAVRFASKGIRRNRFLTSRLRRDLFRSSTSAMPFDV